LCRLRNSSAGIGSPFAPARHSGAACSQRSFSRAPVSSSRMLISFGCPFRRQRADLEGARRPARKGRPDLAPNRHVPKRLAEKAVERKIVMLPGQRVSAALFPGTDHRANRDLARLGVAVKSAQNLHVGLIKRRLLKSQT